MKTDFLKQTATERIKESNKIQIEYNDHDIIIVDVFINELINELIYSCHYDETALINTLSCWDVIAWRDPILCYYKIRFINIMRDGQSLHMLKTDFKIKYAKLLEQLISMHHDN